MSLAAAAPGRLPHELAQRLAGEAATEAGVLNNCRGVTDPEAVSAACDDRDGEASQRLELAGICYSQEGEFGYQHHMQRCKPGPTRLNPE